MRAIDGDALKEYMRNALEETRNCYPDGGNWAETITEEFCKDIDEQPTIEPERKTGRWIKAEGSYVTPGGDEVWQCSECGKGIHVYGIEHGTYGADISDGQWVSCPNCDCLMNEELTNV